MSPNTKKLPARLGLTCVHLVKYLRLIRVLQLVYEVGFYSNGTFNYADYD